MVALISRLQTRNQTILWYVCCSLTFICYSCYSGEVFMIQCSAFQIFSSSGVEDDTDHDLTRQNSIHTDSGCPQMFNGGEIKKK